ncbi:MAG TPA: hypothetical protein VMK16_08135 [Acidimicrobiales bacterium]|nr:hypothetical protein [Acidimicrobiales bacterium]
MSSPQQQKPMFTGWVGWIWFAAFLLILGGIFQIIHGIVSITRGDEYYGPDTQVAVNLGYTAWGWIHIFLGIFMIVGGLSLARGHIYGRIIAVLAACASAIGNVAGLGGANGGWAFLVIVMDLFVIWAVMVHGEEARSDYGL